MRLPIIALLAAAAFCPQAQATAFAGVKEAFWQADFAYYDNLSGIRQASLPAGVVLECAGSAVADGNGCRDQEGLSVVSDGAFKRSVLDVLGFLVLRNEGSVDYQGQFVFETSYSSFNPGGPEIGASVDDPVREFASFFTVVTGPGVFDLHGCAMSGSPGPHFAAVTCGVSVPDASSGEAVFGPLLAGQTISARYRTYIEVIAQGADPVPEPASATLLFAGLVTVASRRKARLPFPQSLRP